MSGLLIRNFTGATSVNYHNGLPYDDDGALLVSQGYCIGQRYDQTTRTSTNGVGTNDTDFQTLASVTLPAGTMGANSRLVIVSDWDAPTVSARTKTFSVYFGGSVVAAPTLDSDVNAHTNLSMLTEIKNLNSLVSQKTANSIVYGTTSVARIATTIDTSAAAAIDFKCKWDANVASETIILVGYSIWHYPGS